MSEIQNIQYSLETSLIRKRIEKSKQKIIGITPEKESFSWEWLGMMLCAGRWAGFISDEKRLEILNTILLYCSIMEVSEYPGDSCLYQYSSCIGTSAYYAPVTDITDSEVIQSVSFSDGTLTIVTNKQTFETEISHNDLADLQGGVSPDEYYHISKALYDELNAVAEVAATASLTVSPSSGVSGNSVTPSITLSYNQGTDTITGHSLKRGTTALSINAVDSDGIGSQTLSDSPVTVDTTYTYTVTVDGESDIVITKTISFSMPFFYGTTTSQPTASEITAASSGTKSANPFSAAYTATEELLWVCYPKSWGVITSILNPNGFEQLPAWGSAITISLTIGSSTVDYYLYVNNLEVTVTSYTLKFYN